jgi:hypothetical protein
VSKKGESKHLNSLNYDNFQVKKYLECSINDWGCSFTPNFRPKKCLKEVKKNDWEKSLRAGSSPVL